MALLGFFEFFVAYYGKKFPRIYQKPCQDLVKGPSAIAHTGLWVSALHVWAVWVCPAVLYQ